jgi:hypothetical protein
MKETAMSPCALGRTILALLASGLCGCRTPAALEPESTYAVIAGVLEWPSRTLSGFPKDNRRDLGLYETLRDKGVPERNMALLLDREATEANLRGALGEIAGRAGPGATLIVYYAGHGYPGSRGIYFASHDAGLKGGPREGFLIDDIDAILGARFRGGRVLLLADCCFAGGLADVAVKLAGRGFAAASLTSVRLEETASDQWTFTCNLIDALRGRRHLDRDGDGFVSLDEAGQSVRDAMHFVESRDPGFSLQGLPGCFRLSEVVVDGTDPDPVTKPFALGQFVALHDKGGKRTARIVGCRSGALQLEIQRYHDRLIVWRKPGEVAALVRPDRPEPAGSPGVPPPELEPAEAAAKATLGGKYRTLLMKVHARLDYLVYGAFSDYGYSKTPEYLGQTGLPEGYWVYVYPWWYIFKDRIRDRGGAKQPPRPGTTSAEAQDAKTGELD